MQRPEKMAAEEMDMCACFAMGLVEGIGLDMVGVMGVVVVTTTGGIAVDAGVGVGERPDPNVLLGMRSWVVVGSL